MAMLKFSYRTTLFFFYKGRLRCRYSFQLHECTKAVWTRELQLTKCSWWISGFLGFVNKHAIFDTHKRFLAHHLPNWSNAIFHRRVINHRVCRRGSWKGQEGGSGNSNNVETVTFLRQSLVLIIFVSPSSRWLGRIGNIWPQGENG